MPSRTLHAITSIHSFVSTVAFVFSVSRLFFALVVSVGDVAALDAAPPNWATAYTTIGMMSVHVLCRAALSRAELCVCVHSSLIGDCQSHCTCRRTIWNSHENPFFFLQKPVFSRFCLSFSARSAICVHEIVLVVCAFWCADSTRHSQQQYNTFLVLVQYLTHFHIYAYAACSDCPRKNSYAPRQ